MVPHLTTALNGPLLELERRFLAAMPQIEHWLRSQWHDTEIPFYCSVDLRNSGFKLAPVDTNLFPGGFNNLNPDFMPLCVQATQMAVEKACPDARSVLLIPENHTRNSFYLQNVAALQYILRQAGLNVRLGSISPEITELTRLPLPDGRELVLEPVQRRGKRVVLDDFNPCLVLLNNDLSAGIPEILQGIEQNLLPPLHAGWAVRRKSQHFSAYNTVAKEFAALIGIDQWLINPLFDVVNNVDFKTQQGEQELCQKTDALLAQIKAKYDEYGIDETPYLIAKADAGTYGMGIMSVKSGEELIGLNRKQRNKMAVVKEGLEVSNVMLQEGVYTFENIHDAVAEPVVYMMDHYVVGGFYRVHTGRGVDENLNAPGMHFVPLAFREPCSLPDVSASPDCATNRFYAYGVVARLALLAAARELEMTAPESLLAEVA